MPTNKSFAPESCQQKAPSEAESGRDRVLRNKVFPVVTAGAASGVARALTSWLLDHVSL
ncbi:hypothetical protein [Micromonospora carbonacea]|uniref:Uncharacterized protein n=1 Tax=Micromonospora carbonacea TaxID=47853 RepID=A0A7H8XG11_9ACTN|nr:hypothetical protein [Micromonospora carbonacea]MBB5829139.1 hypothetical protein [Micromonospora carbonacea]QLD23378.1 hypothetical protein HXZ27_03325 [Micromonospora carbonacea]